MNDNSLARRVVEEMFRADRLEGKIRSALAIADGPNFGEHDGDIGDVLLMLRAAIHKYEPPGSHPQSSVEPEVPE